MRKYIQVIILTQVIIFFSVTVYAKGSPDQYSKASTQFDIFTQQHEGETSFRSLLIPEGGRPEGLGQAFTALANDSNFFFANPAGSAALKNTELLLTHKSGIADARMETIGFTQRQKNFGYGAALRVFYIPFLQYDSFGATQAQGFFSETFAVINAAYNFLDGYDFKGISIGGNVKIGYRAMPPIALSETDSAAQKKAQGRKQNGIAVLGDVGIQVRLNAGNFFDSREPNMYIGLAACNFGAPIRGDIPPSYIALGFAYRPIQWLLFSMEVRQPINVMAIRRSGLPQGAFGIMFSITEFFNFSTGVHLKGGNPRLTMAGEINIMPVQIVATYSLDLTTQSGQINHFSIGAKISLGDRGRSKKADKIETLFIEGLDAYTKNDIPQAIAIWESILIDSPRFDPAIEALRIAKRQQAVQAEVNKLQLLE